MEYLLLIISVILAVTKNTVSKSGRDIFSGISGLFKTNIITSVTGIVIFGIGVSFVHITEPCFLVLAFLYGIMTMLSQTFYIFATKNGSLSVCSLIYSCGFIIPTLFSFFAYNESISTSKALGIIILTASIFIVTGKLRGNGKTAWLIPAFLSMLASGFVGVLQKIFTRMYSNTYYNEYLFTAFTVMLIVSALVMLIRKSSDKTAAHSILCLGSILLPAIFSLCIVFCNKLNLYLTGVIDGIIFFPCYNGSVIAFSAIISSLILKEKLTVFQKSGIVLAVMAITLIAA